MELSNVSVDPNSTIKDYRKGSHNFGYTKSTDDNEDESNKIPNYTNTNSVSSQKRVTYTWSNLTAWIGPGQTPTVNDIPEKNIFGRPKAPTKIILNNVSGVIRPGEFIAVIGASGAGKSTMMDVLTFRNSRKLKVIGQRAINGNVVESNTITSISAYVQQQDLFVGVLTPREHLTFQARVRMDADIPYHERMNRVEEVLQEFGLAKCADARIGTRWLKGISGGEMRRLSIATEVLTNPAFMVLDEPTSGLDSNSAANVLTILSNLAKTGKTVMCSIHQPSSQLFALFDKIMVMTEGRIAYLGTTNECLDFFSQMGHPCPTRYNPSDFLMEILAVTNIESQKKVHRISDAFAETPDAREMRLNIRNRTITGEADVTNETSRYKASWAEQFRAVFVRSLTSYIRDPMVLKMRILQTIILGLFVGTIFFQEEITHADSIQNISGAIFMLLCMLTYQNVFGVLDSFCSELPVFMREHANGMYRTDVYFISKILVEIPFYIILPTLFTAIAYYMIGFDPNIASFLKTSGILILITYICSGLGYLLSCIAASITIALLLAPVAVFPFFLFGGFLVRPGSGVAFLRWLQHISWFYYGYETLAIIQLEAIDHFECGRMNNTTCPADGMAVLESLNFDKDHFNRDIIGLGGLAVAVSILGYLALLSKTIRR